MFLRRRRKICLPPDKSADRLPLSYLASVLKNIETNGFTFSESLIESCRALSIEQLNSLYQDVVVALGEMRGADSLSKPMYPNFPDEVMAMSEGDLYVNAILHYLTAGRYLPVSERRERMPLLDNVELIVIEEGTQDEFEGLLRQIAGGNAAFSEQDREDVTWFIKTCGSDVVALLPDAVPQKENMAFVASLLLQHTDQAPRFLSRYFHTATDVLRLAVAMSGGDVSLATSTRFRSFKRGERDLLLGLLDPIADLAAEMLRWKGRWIRLGERLHPGEYAKKYSQVAEAFRLLRNDLPVVTFNPLVEWALAHDEVELAVKRLVTRPGELARRLDHLLRLNPSTQDAVLTAFATVANRVSTPVLLQVRTHFTTRDVAISVPDAAPEDDPEEVNPIINPLTALSARLQEHFNRGQLKVPSVPNKNGNEAVPLRVFFPKGNLAKAYAIPNRLAALPTSVCERLIALCEAALIARFRALESLGKVYVDPDLARYPVPFATRSASKAFRTVTRGSRMPLPPDCKVLRLFLWWKNGIERTDIDLSATLFDANFGYKDIVSYYNLKAYGGCHSGDIVDAPEGASEFIDITLDTVREQGVRYVVMSLNSYTTQPYGDLPECFAGWMARTYPESGEIYEPKTVQDRLDLTSDTTISLPLIVDIETREVVWCDMALRRHPRWQNNVHGNLSGIALTLQALTQLHKPNLYDLFRLHVIARGESVATSEEADLVFSIEQGTPFRLEEIASGYLA